MFYIFFLIFPSVLERHSQKPPRHVEIRQWIALSSSNAWIYFGRNALNGTSGNEGKSRNIPISRQFYGWTCSLGAFHNQAS